MRTVILILFLLIPSIVFAEGTHTFSQIKSLDVTASYLDIKKIVITKEKVDVAGTEKDILCFTIDGKYKITDTKELILLLLEIIADMKNKP
jgi:hypothetical protein